MSTIGPAAAGQNGPVAFTTTHWSVVLTAQGESSAAREALEKLCRTYWRPLYAYVRQQGYKHEEAEDLTQGFFAVLLQRNGLDSLRKERGRLRSFLLMSLKNFLADEHRRAVRVKRGKGQPLIPLEELRNAEVDAELSDLSTAERIYERRWASTLLDHVFSELKGDYCKAGNAGTPSSSPTPTPTLMPTPSPYGDATPNCYTQAHSHAQTSPPRPTAPQQTQFRPAKKRRIAQKKSN